MMDDDKLIAELIKLTEITNDEKRTKFHNFIDRANNLCTYEAQVINPPKDVDIIVWKDAVKFCDENNFSFPQWVLDYLPKFANDCNLSSLFPDTKKTKGGRYSNPLVEHNHKIEVEYIKAAKKLARLEHRIKYLKAAQESPKLKYEKINQEDQIIRAIELLKEIGIKRKSEVVRREKEIEAKNHFVINLAKKLLTIV